MEGWGQRCEVGREDSGNWSSGENSPTDLGTERTGKVTGVKTAPLSRWGKVFWGWRAELSRQPSTREQKYLEEGGRLLNRRAC